MSFGARRIVNGNSVQRTKGALNDIVMFTSHELSPSLVGTSCGSPPLPLEPAAPKPPTPPPALPPCVAPPKVDYPATLPPPPSSVIDPPLLPPCRPTAPPIAS
ncbi:MAG TPA: hypothetical protein VFQ35_15225 [Polyangiaceae bacterium]|nr:hypothetical protein [Polyangiaceae bacterium]